MKWFDQYLLRDGWLFSKGEHPGAEAAAFDDSGFSPVSLPHDWQIRTEGSAKLIGIDSGDLMRDFDPHSDRCRMKDGHLIAYIRRLGHGPIRVHAYGPENMHAELLCRGCPENLRHVAMKNAAVSPGADI